MSLKYILLALVLVLTPLSAWAQTYTYKDISTSMTPPVLGPNATITLSGYNTPGDLGRGAVFTNTPTCTSASATLLAFKDGSPGPSGPYWFCLQIRGVADVGWFGAKIDGQYAFFNGSISAACVLTASAVTGAIPTNPSGSYATLMGDGVVGSPLPKITSQNHGGTPNGDGTYNLDTCSAVSSPSFTGAISGAATILGGSYNSTSGLVTLQVTPGATIANGESFTISGATGTGANVSSLNGGQHAQAGTTLFNGVTTLTFTIAPSLSITSITGGSVTSLAGTVLTVPAPVPNLAKNQRVSDTPISISSCPTYISGSGAVTCILSTSASIPVGGPFTISGVTGSGSYNLINGAHTATTGTGGTTLNFTIATGLTLTATSATGSVGLAPGTRISGQVDSTHYYVTASQAVGSETMGTTLNMVAWWATDDSGAVKAAAATGADVLIAGPDPLSTSEINYIGMESGVILSTKHQKLIMRSARFLALPDFTDDYVVVSDNSQQVFDHLMIDGGAMIGTVNVGGFQCLSTSDSVLEYATIIHYSTIGADLSNSYRVVQTTTAQWNNHEPQLGVQSNLTAIGRYYNHADSQEIGAYSNFNGINYYFDCLAQTLNIDAIHPYNGIPVANGGTPAVNPENMHISGCAGGQITIQHVYDDDGAINNFDPAVSLRDLWPLQSSTVSTYGNHCFINEYASGASGQADHEDLRLYIQGQLSGSLAFACFNPNPNTATVTGVSAASGSVTLTLAPSPAVQLVGVLVTGPTTVRYRVAEWPNGHPLQPVGTTPGDQIIVTGFSNAAYNGTYRVTKANPFYVEVTSTAMGAFACTPLPTSCMVQPASAWTSDDPMPVANAMPVTQGFINVAGMNPSGYDTVTPAAATAVTANSITYANPTTASFVSGGTVDETWAGDWSGLPALEPDFFAGSIETGSRVIACQRTNNPCWQEYAPAADVTGGIGHTYQIGGTGGPFTIGYNNAGWTSGALSGNSTYCLGLEAAPACLVEGGASNLTIQQANVPRWTFDPAGPLKPGADGATALFASIGTSGLRVSDVYSYAYSLASDPMFVGGGAIPIVSATGSAGTATVTVSAWSPWPTPVVGSSITVAGAGPAYDCIACAVTAVSGFAVSYASSGTGPAPAGATVTVEMVTVSGLGTGAIVAGNGSALIVVTAGASPTNAETLTIPSAAAAKTGWACSAEDLTSSVTGKQNAGSLTNTTSPKFTWSAAPTAGDKIVHRCVAY